MIKVYTTKRAIIDLLTVKEQVTRIFNNNEKYKSLIDFIYAKDYLNDNDLKIPTIKNISNAIKNTPAKTTKLVNELHNDFFENKLDFKNVEIIYFLRYFENHLQLTFNNLKYLPRIGEQVNIPFVGAKVGTSMFYVENIEHTFESDLQKIYVTLKPGYYSAYFNFRKSKALDEGEITIKEYYSDEYNLRKLLNLR